jgi:hypothetical protein
MLLLDEKLVKGFLFHLGLEVVELDDEFLT